jgi:beta-barrel assembly-enhancing protease
MRNYSLRGGAFAILFVLLSAVAPAQDLNNYRQIKSKGELPADLTRLTKDKVKEDINTLKDKSRGNRKSKEQYMLEANYLIDELMTSGKVLVNDPLGIYVNKVADKLLEHDPELRSQVKIYVVKSPVVNAFTFDKGIVFVNVGLLAQLENEAQLAYILAHEITHFTRKHAINAYVEYDRIDKGSSGYGRSSYEDRINAKSTYSKELEYEADLEGLELYLKSGYSTKGVSSAFDVLQYSYLPFEEIEFEKKFLETKNLVLPEDYFLPETAPIKSDDNYDDSKSTHPNVRKRRNAVLKKLDDADEASRKKYLVSEEEFKKVRELSRFESCRLFLIHRDYAEAIYSAYILLKKYPGNLYLEKIMAKALYNMSAYKNKGRMGYKANASEDLGYDRYFRLTKYEDIEGSSQQVYHLLHKLSRDEMAVVALSYVWKVRQKAPDDQMLNAITDSLFTHLVFANNLHPADFSKKPRPEVKVPGSVGGKSRRGEARELSEDSTAVKAGEEEGAEEPKEQEEDPEEESKYSKIKKKQVQEEDEKGQNFIKYAFADLLADKEFMERFSYFSDKAESRRSKTAMNGGSEDWADSRKEKKEQKRLRRKGLSLGIDKIVIVDPYYSKIDRRKTNSVKYFASETSQQSFTQSIVENAEKVGLQYEMIDPNSFQVSDVEKFNDYSIINDWVVERYNHESKSNAIVCNSDEINELVKKYGTKYFMWTGVINVREKKDNVLTSVLLIALIYTSPLGIYNLVKPEHETLYYSILFDIETGQVMMLDVNTVGQKDTRDLLNSYIYDTLHQVKKKDKKKDRTTVQKD